MVESRGLNEVVDAAIEQSLLGGPRKYTRTQVAELSGVSVDRAQRLWVALGFAAASSDDEIAFTDADIAAVRTFAAMSPATTGDEQGQIAEARTLGQAMARLAEWQADLITREIEHRIATEDDGATAEPNINAAARTIETLTELQEYAWHRHLAAALARSVESGSTTRQLLVGFADMVGYTRLSRHLEADELTNLLETFETALTDAITTHGGWVIKNVGDEVMFAATNAAEGARIALAMNAAITAAAQKVPEIPQIRVGLAYGEVLTRFGDLYGTVVNTASRLTGVARPGTVLLDDGAAAALGDQDEFVLRHLRGVRVKGFSRLGSHVLRTRKR
ncbi:adenylate/guanylate cyclase domain-containing protein [Mycobacterium sp. CBMA271]|uniref:adenylate/guanylate cyclase domain-containing protein n=1 Tax=unclassified Mycobacteroides TaxID=2618759 RepID=UPI0012DF31D6|nr:MULTISPECIES: adenylate/guanylate cyclase domain-containing protein [unclassified Mycobacteroides]MUM19355.1 adenylate cyclase [Mycobacteroides sp. CBMA 326]MUM21769.1 adenylate/guanylate cyclase domain-containing protein [Mycobacteroides sp. CBMA 271]